VKKQRKVVKHDYFTDYEGKQHWFTVVAISTELDPVDGFSKMVEVGISFCSTKDKFNPVAGERIATNKATLVLCGINNADISSEVVNGLIEQKLRYIKNNPEQFSKSYAEAKHKYEFNKILNENLLLLSRVFHLESY